MKPEDLRNHTGFVYNGPVRPQTEALELNGQVRPIRFKSMIHATDILMIKQAVLDGRGVAVDMPLLHCAEEIAAGRLQIILKGWHRPPVPRLCRFVPPPAGTSAASAFSCNGGATAFCRI